MASIRAVPLRQISYVKRTLDRARLAIRERIYVWPIAQKRRMTSLPGIPSLLLFITSYPFWRNSSHPALCHFQDRLRLRIVYGHFAIWFYDVSTSVAR